MLKRDVVIVLGHDALSKGAYSSFLGLSEYDYNKRVAALTGCDVHTHAPGMPYSYKMKSTYKKLSHDDLTLELHFNAASPQAHGTESLFFHTNAKGKEYAQRFSNMCSRAYGTRNRGAKPLSNKNQRGYWAVASGIPTGLILEPFFGSNEESLKFTNPKKYAELICDFIDQI